MQGAQSLQCLSKKYGWTRRDYECWGFLFMALIEKSPNKNTTEAHQQSWSGTPVSSHNHILLDVKLTRSVWYTTVVLAVYLNSLTEKEQLKTALHTNVFATEESKVVDFESLRTVTVERRNTCFQICIFTFQDITKKQKQEQIKLQMNNGTCRYLTK